MATKNLRFALRYTPDVIHSLLYDIGLVFTHLRLLPGIFYPLRPFLSAELDEIFPSFANLRVLFLHLLYTIFQIAFLIILPICIPAPPLFFIAYVAAVIFINKTVCNLTLNGQTRFITSDIDISKFPRHDSECWIFINGIGVGHQWLQSNVNLLAKTFGREILCVHNPTYGVLLDIIHCLIMRDGLSPTQDSYDLVEHTLKDTQYNKVVLILHSQGGIQGSFIIDELVHYLLKGDLLEEDLHKLEVYTFAAAANHFYNPTQRILKLGGSNEYLIPHIEHYANSGDFVSRLGVLNFAKPEAPAYRPHHFIGKLFERPASGHMLNQHYLDSMFPLNPNTGLVADTNEFMETMVDEIQVVAQGSLPPGSLTGTNTSGIMKPISELSHLWKYRNGMSP